MPERVDSGPPALRLGPGKLRDPKYNHFEPHKSIKSALRREREATAGPPGRGAWRITRTAPEARRIRRAPALGPHVRGG